MLSGLLGLLFYAAMIILPVWFGVYVVRSLRQINVNLMRINEALRRRNG